MQIIQLEKMDVDDEIWRNFPSVACFDIFFFLMYVYATNV